MLKMLLAAESVLGNILLFAYLFFQKFLLINDSFGNYTCTKESKDKKIFLGWTGTVYCRLVLLAMRYEPLNSKLALKDWNKNSMQLLLELRTCIWKC